MELSDQERRRAFNHWLRRGSLPTVRLADGTELKFNPYHDPRNGRFTFAPGGAARARQARLAPGGQGPAMGRGPNSRAFERPMTLEQTFPGLRQAPGGAIIAVADGFFNFTGPATEAQIALVENWTTQVKAEIKAIDPRWRQAPQAPTATLQGKINQLNDLKFERAAILFRIRGEVSSLQVETLRFMQDRTDRAYEQGLHFLKTKRLPIKISERLSLGNYIDARVRSDLRARFRQFNIV